MVPANFRTCRALRPAVNIQVRQESQEYRVAVFRHSIWRSEPLRDFFGPFSQGNPPGGFEQGAWDPVFIMSREDIFYQQPLLKRQTRSKVKLANAGVRRSILGRDPRPIWLCQDEGSSDLQPLTLGKFRELKVAAVVAVGVLSTEQTVTQVCPGQGRVIGTARMMTSSRPMLHQSGNSGGPLIHMKGGGRLKRPLLPRPRMLAIRSTWPRDCLSTETRALTPADLGVISRK